MEIKELWKGHPLCKAGKVELVSAITEEYMKPSEVFRSLVGAARPA